MAKGFREILDDEKALNKFVEEIFQQTDKDSSGKIDRNEIYNLLSKLCSEAECATPNREDVDEIFKTFDANQNKLLEKNEFNELIRTVLEMLAQKFEL